ncbi:cation:proton antiporter [Vampirovibrio sp.]|uniref:cation:proton antiporter domain-containing protein n=1 Tax=Vampirovibrio sp. TaxID=2717857 RepID=UPI0035946FCB
MLSGLSADTAESSVLIILALIFSIGAILAYVLQRFHLPTFLAFILTGILLGPNALNLVRMDEIQTMAQIGIIFLLFIVGLDLSVDKLRQLRYQAPLAGILQLGFTTLILTFALRYLAAFPWQLAFLLGSILSLSSTAIVLKSLEEHREIDSDHGRLILGILIIQDLSIIPLMALVPSLTQPFHPSTASELGWVLGKALLFGAIAVAISLKLVPVFLDRLASTNKKEVFTLALVCTGLGMALITHLLGLSYEAGAFVAGLSLSRSLFCRQIISDSKAFRDVFITLFFVSMGLLFDIRFLIQHIWLVAGVTLFLILLKAACAYAAVRVLKFPNRTALWAGLSLFQVGEFSFVLLGRTLDTVSHVPDWEKLLSFWNPLLINAIIISMFLTPLVLRALHRMTAPYLRARLKKAEGTLAALEELESPTNRVIIAGYGPIARNLATALAEKDIPYTIVEMNLKTIRKLKAKGVSCLYGDISRPEILEDAGIAKSNILVITFPDTRTAEATIQLAKQLNPGIHAMVRSRYRVDVDRLHRIGVDSVIHEEFETSVSFIFNIMNHMKYPVLETDRLIAKVRSLESKLHPEAVSSKHPMFGRFSLLEGTQIEWLEVGAACTLIGKSLKDAKIREKTGVNIIAVVQAADQSQVAADPDLMLSAQDVLVALGNLSQLQALESLLYK